MSPAKRSRGRPSDVKSASPLPASKRQKTTATFPVPKKPGLDFLVDEDARSGKKLEARYVNGAPRVQTEQFVSGKDRTQITSGEPAHQVKQKYIAYVELSSGEEEESSEYETDEDDEDERTQPQAQSGATALVSQFEDDAPLLDGHATEEEINGIRTDDDKDADQEEASDDEDEPEQQTFGDQLRARHPEPIDTRDSLYDDAQAVVPTNGNRQLTAFSSTSLTTVLTQSLKTNDKELLERCLQTRDKESIKATIERLNPQLGAQLLQRIAEIIYQRPGRSEQLFIWIQWTLVTQGAYIASQPDVMERLKVLRQVLKQRASGIEPLLHLRGKLNLLRAQLTIRQKMLLESRGQSEEEEQPTIYEEGRNEDDWSVSDVEMDDALAGERGSRSVGNRGLLLNGDEVAVHINGKLPTPTSSRSARGARTLESRITKPQSAPLVRDQMTNGVNHNDVSEMDEDEDESDVLDDAEEEDYDEEDDGEGEGLLDIEAEEASDEGEMDGEPEGEEDALDSASASASELSSGRSDVEQIPTSRIGLKNLERKR